ncbi:MAG: hypothetical protein ACXW1T_01590 [Methylophilus sp.]
MFTLPSMWNIIVSTIVFVIAAWYLRRWLETHGLPHGMTRGLLVFLLAYLVSWGAGAAVDWGHEKIYGPEPESQLSQELNQLVKDNGIVLP